MKKPRPDTLREPTQMEIDLAKHLNQRIDTVLGDFMDTAEIAKVPYFNAGVLVVGLLLDAAITGMITLRFTSKDMEVVINSRVREVLKKEMEK